MPRWVNIFAQVVGTVGQGLNVFGGYIPPKYQGFVALGLGLAQTVVAGIAHGYNTDGTPQSVAFVPKTQ